MTGRDLAAVLDVVLALSAILGGVAAVGMAMGWAVQCGRHQADANRWHRERRRLLTELADAHAAHAGTCQELIEACRSAQAGWADARDGWSAAAAEAHARGDEEALARHHTAAAAEGLTAPPPDGLTNDPRWS